MCQYNNMPIEEKLQLIVCGTVESWNCGIVELCNRGAWLCLSLLLCLCLCLCLSLRLPKPETDEKPYNLLILTKKKSTSLLS